MRYCVLLRASDRRRTKECLQYTLDAMDEIKKSDYTNYCLRHTASGSRYYVIRDGMIVRAALLPVNLSGNLLETLQKMVNMARETARLCKTEDKEAE